MRKINTTAVENSKRIFSSKISALFLSLQSALFVSPAIAELPSICAPCDSSGAMITWTTPGSASQYIVDGAKATVKQALDRETFNWRTFNIGPDNTVTFDQPSSTSVALNRIFQNDPSRIFGALKANGQVILINQNGILFERGASVDVNTLVASSLALSETAEKSIEFARVIETDLSPAFKSANGGVGDVNVARGASIKAQKNGRVILIGGNVTNSGTIEVSGRGGQAILAAENDEVYLYLDDDPNVRGLAVALTDGGTVTNGGTVLADQGNITLAGLTINQAGVLRATSAVDANGSIRLQARDQSLPPTFSASGRLNLPRSIRGATVNFGSNSVTEVMPLADDATTAIDAQPVLRSLVDVDAQDITIEQNARISVPGGRVSMLASAQPDVDTSSSGTIRIDPHARIDVSGLDDVAVSVARNFVEQEVRRNELADVPVQRDGPLFGKTVTFDVRKQLPEVLNVDAAVANVERTVAERATVGGDIVLTAADRIDIAAGAVLDVSGGVLEYTAALVSSTKLILDGRVVDISEASADLSYDAVLADTAYLHSKWGAQTTEFFFSLAPAQQGALSTFEPGYLEGKDAGTITVRAPRFDVRADLIGGTERGRFQLLEPGSAGGFARQFDEISKAGKLNLISSTLEQDLVYNRDGFGFNAEGFADLDIAVGNFELVAGGVMRLPERGSFSVRAADSVAIAGTITGSGGSVDIQVNALHGDIERPQDETGAVILTDTAIIDLEGGWFIDESQRTQRVNEQAFFIDGGHFTVSVVGDLIFEAGSFVDVGGGAFVDPGGVVNAGRGGSVSLSNATFSLDPSTVDLLESSRFVLDGLLEGFTFPGAAHGASLFVSAPQIHIGSLADPLESGTLELVPALFTDFGFHHFSIKSNERVIKFQDGLSLDIFAKNLAHRALPSASISASRLELPASGTDIDLFASEMLIEESLRSATSLTVESAQIFSTISGPVAPHEPLVVPADVRVSVDNGGRVALTNSGSIVIAGELIAPGGEVELNTTTFGSFGYLANFAVWLEDSSFIDVSGRIVPTSGDSFGRVSAVERFDGGTVSINSRTGYIIAMPGSEIDVSGGVGSITTTRTNLTTGLPETALAAVGSNAGEISLTSAAGIQFYADINGAAAARTGALGGRLSITLDGNLRIPNQGVGAPNAKYPSVIVDGTEELRVQLGDTQFPAEILSSAALPDEIFQIAAFSIEQFTAGGFDSLDLSATPNRVQKDPASIATALSSDPLMEALVELIGDGTINIPRSLSINAPIIKSDGGGLQINTAYLRLGFADNEIVTSDSPVPIGEIDPEIKYFSAEPGSGAVSFKADFIDFEGFTALHGFGESTRSSDAPVTFSSTGDIRLRGVRSPSRISLKFDGALIAQSDITFIADRIYGSTLSDFLISNEQTNGRVTFSANGSAARSIPASAGSNLTVRSDRIAQLGHIFAPIGTITLDAESELVLGSNSLTSVTATDNTILFGRTEVGEWVFPFRDSQTTRVFDARSDRFDQLPSKQINLIADGIDESGMEPVFQGNIDILPGAVLDVRSGGTLLATEFLPGPQGKIDVLDASRASGSFALLPLTELGIAPFDPLDMPAFEFGSTAQVAITDGGESGLAPGLYAVLPPRYALLPGGVLLSPDSDAGSSLANSANPTKSAAGLPLVAGHLSQFGARGGRTEVDYFQVESRAELLTRAEYRQSSADEFFVTQALDFDVPPPLLPRDSGSISIATNAVLTLGGTITSERNIDGIGSRVDISAQRVLIGDRDTSVVADGVVLLDPRGLEGLKANSLLIGGRRTATGDGTTIETVTTTDITVGSGSKVNVSELILAATDSVIVETGAIVEASGAPASGGDKLSVNGEGAVLLVTSGDAPNFFRQRATPGTVPLLQIAVGASIFGSGGLILDSTGQAEIVGAEIGVGAGGSIYVGAERILIGDAPSASTGLLLAPDFINNLKVDEFTLASQTAVEFYGDVDLDIDFLTIDAGGIIGATGVGDVSISGRLIEIKNSSGSAINPISIGDGAFSITATETMRFGKTNGLDESLVDNGDFDIRGFDVVSLAAPLLLAVDEHELSVGGTTTLTTALLSSADGAAFDFVADGALTLRSLALISDDIVKQLDLLGGRITLEAAMVDVGTTIFAPSGVVEISAVTGDLHLRSNAALDSAGISGLALGSVNVNSPGGIVDLSATLGSVTLDPGAFIDVSAGHGEFSVSGGFLSINAGGALNLSPSSVITGRSNLSGIGSAASFDILKLGAGGSFSALNDSLNTGGFSAVRTVHLRGPGESLTVAADDVIVAQEIHLVVDDGDLNIAGTLAADGARGGWVDLIAGADLIINSAARISAVSTGGFLAPNSNPEKPVYEDGFQGGTIDLTSTRGQLIFETSGAAVANLQVAGTKVNSTGELVTSDNGTIRLTAPRTITNGVDVGSRAVGGAIMPGYIEAAIGGADHIDVIGNKVYATTAAGTIVGQSVLTEALAGSGIIGQDVRLVAGVEVVSPTNINVNALGLSFPALFDASSIAPGVLTFRSAGDLSVTGDIRDGTAFDAFFEEIADANDSWTLRFVGGADLASADPLATVAGSGKITVNAGVDIWTGTGDIVLRSGDNIEMRGNTTIASIGRHADLVDYQGAYTDAFVIGATAISYPEFGGNIDIRANGDIDITSSAQTVKSYTYYFGAISDDIFSQAPRAWGYSLASLRQNLSSLAGGNVSVQAGGHLDGGQFTVATSGRADGDVELGPFGTFDNIISEKLTELGGGSLAIFAQGDIRDVDITVLRGQASLRTYGEIGSDEGPSSDPRLFIGDATYNLEAGSNIELGLVVDPTITQPSTLNPSSLGGTYELNFLSATANASLDVFSSAGDVTFNNPSSSAAAGVSTTFPSLLNTLPSMTGAVAASGSVYLANQMSLFPSARGTLQLVARDDVGPAPSLPSSSAVNIVQFESDPNALVTSELSTTVGASSFLGLDTIGISPLHMGDADPNVVVAARGDIRNLDFVSAKSTLLDAGRDISRVAILTKHVSLGDTSLFLAGRDIVQPTVRNPFSGALLSSDDSFFRLQGPGDFSFLAGRDIDLGTSDGIRSVGATLDQRLPSEGASINLIAGLTRSRSLGGVIPPIEATTLLLAELEAAGRSIDRSLPLEDQFRNIDLKDRISFFSDSLFEELKASGIAASDPASPLFRDYSRGFDAIKSFFNDENYDGDIRTPLSTVQTIEGGTIRVLAPGGSVDAGLTATDGLGAFKGDDELGFIVFREGDVKAFVHENFNVNSTRVFAQQGGDIVIWSSTGDIDAGRGAKSAAALAAPSAEFDAFGNFLDKTPLQVVGSGIRNFAPSGVEAGTLFLFAPLGIVNAGDAGIGSAGNIVIGATQVIGADNIDIGGVAVGVPVSDGGGISAGLASVGDVAAGATSATQKQAAAAGQNQSAAADAFAGAPLSLIQVEVLGFGT